MLSSSLISDAVGQTEIAKMESRFVIAARNVRQELLRSGYAAMRRVDVAVEDGVLTLLGDVYSFHMKQTAQEIARKAAPDVTIENRLAVVPAPGRRPK